MSEFINKRPVENCFFLKYLQRNLFKKDKKYYFFVCPMPIYINKERDIFYCEVLAFICPLYILYILYMQTFDSTVHVLFYSYCVLQSRCVCVSLSSHEIR